METRTKESYHEIINSIFCGEFGDDELTLIRPGAICSSSSSWAPIGTRGLCGAAIKGVRDEESAIGGEHRVERDAHYPRTLHSISEVKERAGSVIQLHGSLRSASGK